MATQKVRIKVLIDATGNYCGYGWKDAKGSDPDETLYDVIEGPAMQMYWITAEVPIPNAATPEIEAKLETTE